MSMNCGECREPDKRDDIGRHGTGPNVGLDLKAVRTGIGAELRTLHSDVLREEVPDGMAELLKQLDQQRDADSIWRPLARAERLG
jgi:Anti-sigma factor NepR